MTDSMIEKVAKAIYEADPESGYDADDPRTFWRASDSYWDDCVWEPWEKIARAAIKTLMEPTEEMTDAGGEIVSGFVSDFDLPWETAAEVFEAMLRAALQQPDAAGE